MIWYKRMKILKRFGRVKRIGGRSEEYIARSEAVRKKATTPFTRAGPHFLFLPSMWAFSPTFAPVNHTPPTSISSILILCYATNNPHQHLLLYITYPTLLPIHIFLFLLCLYLVGHAPTLSASLLSYAH